MSSFIRVTKVKKAIDEFTLGPLDIIIEAGTVTALVGDNGAGKSTLLKMIMDLVRHDEGTITRFNDTDNWKQSIAYLPQSAIGFDGFTGSELKELIAHWYPNWDESLFMEMVEQFQLTLTKPYHKLSQGMQQKLHLALTVPRNTALLILDEPTSFLDIPSKHYVFDLLARWMEKADRAILLATHQADEIKKLADYIVLLKSGTSLGQVEKDDIIQRFRKYWFVDPVPFKTLPGELTRDNGEVISYLPEETEAFLQANGLQILKSSSMELEEIIMLLLTQPVSGLPIYE